MGFKSGFIVGSVVGAAVALLYAPQPGRRTREKLGAVSADMPGRTEEFVATFREASADLQTVWKNFVAAKQQQVKDAFSAGKQAAADTEAELRSEVSSRMGGSPGGPPPWVNTGGNRPAGGPPPGARPAGPPAAAKPAE